MSSLVLMVRVPCLICFMWPFCILLDSRKCFEAVVAVRPGNMVRLLCCIAERIVAFSGNVMATCR